MTITNENDEAYANAAYINNSEEIVADWLKKAKHFRSKKIKSGKAKIDIAYGASDRQKCDIFQPDTKPLGTVATQFELDISELTNFIFFS